MNDAFLCLTNDDDTKEGGVAKKMKHQEKSIDKNPFDTSINHKTL